MTVGRETPSRSAISVLETPSAASNSSLARQTSTAGAWVALAQWPKLVRSSGATGKAAAEGMGGALVPLPGCQITLETDH